MFFSFFSNWRCFFPSKIASNDNVRIAYYTYTYTYTYTLRTISVETIFGGKRHRHFEKQLKNDIKSSVQTCSITICCCCKTKVGTDAYGTCQKCKITLKNPHSKQVSCNKSNTSKILSMRTLQKKKKMIESSYHQAIIYISIKHINRSISAVMQVDFCNSLLCLICVSNSNLSILHIVKLASLEKCTYPK